MSIPTFADTGTGLLNATIVPLLNALQAKAGVFVGTGFTLLALAVTLSALFGLYEWWTSGSFQDLVANFVRLIIVIAPLVILFNGWTGYMKSFQEFFYTELPQKLSLTSSTPAGLVGESMDKLMKAVDPGEKPAADADADWWELIKMETIYNAIIWLLLVVLNTLLAFGILFAIFMPIAGMYIGAIFGPLLLAFMVWRPMADMASRWVGFMVANGITFVVAVVILDALKVALTNINAVLVGMNADGFGTGLAGFLVTLVALFAIYIFAMNLMLQANNIAQGMTGGATVGEGLFGKLAAAGAAVGMGAAAKAGVKGTAGGMKVAAKTPGAVATAAGKTAEAAAVRAGSERLMSAGTSIRNAGEKMSGAANAVGNVLEKSPSAGLKDIKDGAGRLAGKAGNVALNHIAGVGGKGGHKDGGR